MSAEKNTWAIDPTHSEIIFKVKHLVISTVTGRFQEFEGKVVTGAEDFTDAEIEFSANIASISTGNEQRDGHLKSGDFFDAEQFPTLNFKSNKLEKISGSDYKLTGDLTIRDVTKTVDLKVEYGGTVQDPYGNTKAGFELTGKISRKEFGLTWSAVTEAGSIVVGDDIKLAISVQFAKQ